MEKITRIGVSTGGKLSALFESYDDETDLAGLPTMLAAKFDGTKSTLTVGDSSIIDTTLAAQSALRRGFDQTLRLIIVSERFDPSRLGDLDPANLLLLGFDLEDLEDTATMLGIANLSRRKLDDQAEWQEIVGIYLDGWRDDPWHLLIDLELAPKFERLMPLVTALAGRIASFDLITPRITDDRDRSRLLEVGRQITKTLFELPEKRMNVFTEESEFLIYRPMVQQSAEDCGWFILRGVPTDLKIELMAAIPRGRITQVELPLEGEPTEYLITKTTMSEQNKLCCISGCRVVDTALFPAEKAMMCFELLVTYSA